MANELLKRTITSIILFLFAIFSVFYNSYIFFIVIFLLSCLCWLETNTLIEAIFRENKIFFLNTLTFFYFFGLFIISCLVLYLEKGPFFFFYILLISMSSDIGGYVIGNIVGGKKLTKISPNKTISGSLGSFVFSIMPLIFYNYFFKDQYALALNNFLFCIGVSLAVQLGDIFISYLKRKAKVKDTGKLLPGHGGLLDRIDGLILAIPFTVIYIFGFSYFKQLLNLIK